MPESFTVWGDVADNEPATPDADTIVIYYQYGQLKAKTADGLVRSFFSDGRIPYLRSGTLTAVPGVMTCELDWPGVVTKVRATVSTAPTGASIILDLNLNGATMFTTQANRPTIAAGTFVSPEAIPDVTAFAQLDVLTVDVDQVGSTVAGANLQVYITYRRT